MNTLWNDFRNAFRNYDNGLVQLILINLSVFVFFKLIFVFMWLFGVTAWYTRISYWFMLPASIFSLAEKPWTLISYFFFHEGLMHVVFNMLFLWWFGRIIHEFIGNKRLISLYILGGLAGGIFFILMYNIIPKFAPLVGSNVLLGASGSVYAIVIGAATLAPNYQFNLILIGPVKIVYIALFYVLISFFEIAGNNPGGNLAHLGGSILGYLFITQLRRGSDLGKPVIQAMSWISDLFLPRQALKKTKGGSISIASTALPEDEEIDLILDKISKSGYESLTKAEKQKLFQASQKK